MTDLSTQLSLWREGKLRQSPTKPLLGRLEKALKSKEEKIRESRTLTPEAKRLEITEARRRFRQDRRRLRLDILEGMDETIAQKKREANPGPSAEVEGRMATLAPVFLPRWERSYGNALRDAEEAASRGDEAKLRLLRAHAGVVTDRGAHDNMLEGVNGALDTFKTDAQRKAALDARSAEIERNHFELATEVRPIARLYPDLPPANTTPSPMAVPQR